MAQSSTTDRPVLVLRHVEHVPLGSLETIFTEARLCWRYVDLFAAAPPLLPLEHAAGLVILGGPMSANDAVEFPFLVNELNWICEAVEAELPTLGLCLGAQLMAKALGRAVYPNRPKEIGWYELEVRDEAASDPLLGGSRPVETVFQWHGDTFELPDGAIHLAQSRLCPNQAFRVGRRAWALQFHAEMTIALIDEWLTEPGFETELDQLDYIDPAQIRAQIPQQLPAMESFCHRVLRRFAALCTA
jgi:GMP synthase (glutamine-hydrolysing)